MRISKSEINTINTLAPKYFGNQAKVSLFGSRTDNSKKGGDIDLYIQSKQNEKLTVENKLLFKTELMLTLGEQKIDVILDNVALRKTNFYRSIKNHSIVL